MGFDGLSIVGFFVVTVLVVVIASLDRPESGYFAASQQPLVVLREEMSTAFEIRHSTQDVPQGGN